jgi:cysteine desulfurase
MTARIMTADQQIRPPIYLDNHATTQVDPRVLAAMLPSFTEQFGNAASRSHAYGWAAERAVETARAQVASLLGATAKEIVFTSGATESNNLALKGVAEALQAKGRHILTQATEHKAVLDTCAHLEKQGYQINVLSVDRGGFVSPEQVRAALRDDTILVSIMAANNEIGVLQPIGEIGAICRERGVLFHSDAVQAAGKIPLDMKTLPVDLLSISAHKMYGPKGVGALYVRRSSRKIPLMAQMDGGGHERGRRSGTLNVPGIVGLGAACALAQQEMAEESTRLRRLRDRLKSQLEAALSDVAVNGAMEPRLPGNLNMLFRGVEGEALMMALNDVAVSSGSACTSDAIEASHVLRAIGRSDDEAHSSIRFGLGRFTTEDEINCAAARVIECVQQLRELLPREMADAAGVP